jgi:UDP-N-acetylglucosamine transferase subunit ALG13
LTVHLAASPGGHLDELEPVAAAFADQRRVWVTLPGPRGDALRAAGEEVHVLPEYSRSARGQARLWAAAFAFVARQRPRLVITTGAGATVPVCWATRAQGGDVFFVETSARIHAPSMSGRMVGPIATRRFIQWPELASHFRDAILCRPILFDAVRPRTEPAGEGTLVMVGTHTSPFRRLLDMSGAAIASGLLPLPATVQSGAAGDVEADGAEVRPFVTPAEADALLTRSRYVVCHGGAGTIAGALRAGRRPLVLARQSGHGEHFDDHQGQIVERLASTGLVVELTDRITPEHLAAADAPLGGASAGAWGPSVAEAARREAELRGRID